MDRFDALQAFARVVESGSFTKAAHTLHMSRTTVTLLVQQIEARLRVKLLHRTTRSVQLTADGAAYYPRVVRLLADLEDADASLSSALAAPRGRLRVDVPSPLASLVLIPALPAFHAQYPDIQLHLGVSDRVVDIVSDQVDCVVRGGTVTNPSLIARHVGDLTLRVYAAPSYLQRCGVPQHPTELEGPHHHTVGFVWARTGKPLPFAMRRAPSRCRHRAAMCARWTMAMPTWPQAWRAWVCCGCPTTWRSRMWPRAPWCRCLLTGRWTPCPCTSPTHRTATSAPSCASSSIGWRH